jgi:hypothetical protein
MKDTQLKKDIMNIAKAESADGITICCGTLLQSLMYLYINKWQIV